MLYKNRGALKILDTVQSLTWSNVSIITGKRTVSQPYFQMISGPAPKPALLWLALVYVSSYESFFFTHRILRLLIVLMNGRMDMIWRFRLLVNSMSPSIRLWWLWWMSWSMWSIMVLNSRRFFAKLQRLLICFYIFILLILISRSQNIVKRGNPRAHGFKLALD